MEIWIEKRMCRSWAKKNGAMINHIYIINEGARASLIGVGTYIKQLVECFKNDDTVSLNIVTLKSDCEEFTVRKPDDAVCHIDIPNVSGLTKPKENQLYYRNVACLLASFIHISVSDRIIFHFNIPAYYLLKNLKKLLPKCDIVYTIHFISIWLQDKGNIRLIKDQVNQKQSSESMNNDEKQMFQEADHIICLSKFTKNLLIDDYKIAAKKISLIHNGIKDERKILSENEKMELKQKWLIPCDEKIIIYVGRLNKAKGIEILIHAFKKVVNEIPNSRLVIVGNGDFLHYFKMCKGFWNKISFTGVLDKESLYDFYRIADVGVMPSYNEQCSYVAIEMMMHGLSLIGTTTPGLDEMIDNPADKMKIVFTDYEVSLSSDHLAERIIQKLRHNNKKDDYRTVYLTKYTLDNMYAKTKAVYHLQDNNPSNEV